MKITLEQQEMPLLNLKKVQGTITFEGKTPSNQDLKEEIATKTKADLSLIQIQHIYTGYREQTANFTANIYKDQVTKNKFLTKKEKAQVKKDKEEAAKKYKEEKAARKKAEEEAKAAENAPKEE